MVVPEQDLKSLIVIQPGDPFAQNLLTLTEKAMGLRLGLDGYAFAQVRALPELDKDKKTAAITFFVDPKSRAYVRHINFNGTDNVNDEVLRRRDDADGERLPVERAHRSLAGSAPALAVHREVSSTRRRRCRAAPTSWTSTSRSRKVCRVSSAAARLLRHLWRDARRQLRALELHGHGQPACGQSAGRQVPEGLRRERYGRLSDRGRSGAAAIGVLARQQAVHVHGFSVLDDDAVGRNQLGVPDQRAPTGYVWSHVPTSRPRDELAELTAGARLGARERRP